MHPNNLRMQIYNKIIGDIINLIYVGLGQKTFAWPPKHNNRSNHGGRVTGSNLVNGVNDLMSPKGE